MPKLSDSQAEAALKSVPDWSLVGEEIQRTYQFKNFAASLKFVNSVGQAAEKANHHPDILIRYNKVTLTLVTHDAGGLTEKDFDLALQADGMFAKAK